VGLAGNRGLLLAGEPGTAKSMLSELLAAAISGCSTNTHSRQRGHYRRQIKYSWNYALLLAQGPSLEALVPAPLYIRNGPGRYRRFEEITRCPPEIQDTLVSVLSEKLLMVPELRTGDCVLLAKAGLQRDRYPTRATGGVHEMSSALKRRFNFETVHPIQDFAMEVELVARECRRLLADSARASRAGGGRHRDPGRRISGSAHRQDLGTPCRWNARRR